MEEEPGGARSGGNNSLQRWQIAAVAVAGILGVALCIVLPREVITLILICGMMLFATIFLVGAVLVELSRAPGREGVRRGLDAMESNNMHRANVRILQYHYDERSIRIWFSNHEVHEYTIDLVGPLVLGEMCRLADLGRGLEVYLQSKAVKAVVPRKWMEWLKC